MVKDSVEGGLVDIKADAGCVLVSSVKWIRGNCISALVTESHVRVLGINGRGKGRLWLRGFGSS